MVALESCSRAFSGDGSVDDACVAARVLEKTQVGCGARWAFLRSQTMGHFSGPPAGISESHQIAWSLPTEGHLRSGSCLIPPVTLRWSNLKTTLLPRRHLLPLMFCLTVTITTIYNNFRRCGDSYVCQLDGPEAASLVEKVVACLREFAGG